jgi:cytochrome c553
MGKDLARHLTFALLAAGLPLAQPAAAQNKDVNVAMCEGCHGIPGYKTAFPSVYHVPLIGGQQPAYIIAALKAYKSGERSHPSMRGIAANLSEEDMKKYADYYGGEKK